MPIQITKTYEYKFVEIELNFASGGMAAEDAAFNALGEEGWELVVSGASTGAFGTANSNPVFLFRKETKSITID